MFAMANLRHAVMASAVCLLALVANGQETGSGACTDVHIFLSRGNNEPYPGRQGKLVQAICSGLESCDYEDIVFNNLLSVEYCSAVEAGRKAGIDQLTAYNEKCPDTKLVVSGYSQGAHVVGDILGGGGGVFFQGCTTPSAPGIDANSAPGNMIAAALLFGNTRHTAGQSFNTLAGAPFNGLFPRAGQQLAALNTFAGVLRDWCQGDDPICAAGDGTRTTNAQDHLNYFDVYSGAAGEWVKSMLGDTTSPTSSSTTALSTTTTSTEESSSTVISTTTTSSAAISTTSTSTSISTSTPSSSSTLTSVSETTSGITGSSSMPVTSSSTSSIVSSTILPEATDSSPVASPSATSTSQDSGAGVVACFKLYLGLAALASVLFMTA
ncbi:carbohydrate esterase family 5 protein [Hypoxylon cercidicola]|nr:carbohydrate esterase family 5 protein [Hypoxylon cercidicola]